MRAISLAALLLILPCADVRCCQLPVASCQRFFYSRELHPALVSDPDSFPVARKQGLVVGRDEVSNQSVLLAVAIKLGGVVN